MHTSSYTSLIAIDGTFDKLPKVHPGQGTVLARRSKSFAYQGSQCIPKVSQQFLWEKREVDEMDLMQENRGLY